MSAAPSSIPLSRQPATEVPQALANSGCTDILNIGGQWCVVKRFNFTTAVVAGLSQNGDQRQYCYEHRADARAALLAWDGRKHPTGPWVKCNGKDIDLLNPELC